MDPQGPIQTFHYMLLGYAVILGWIAALLASMIVRYRNLTRELKMLQDLEKRGQN
jgi:uncharacterized membrane protein (DUF106 family)